MRADGWDSQLASGNAEITRPGAVRRWAVLAAMLAGLLAGCAPPRPPASAAPSSETPEAPEAPAGFPEAYYRQAEAGGGTVLRVDPRQSQVVVQVYRGGSLARLGHDHVVTSHDVRGYVAPDEGRADLYVPLDRLAVDEPELRAQAGFDTVPSRDAIEGTRRNMLEKVLEAQQYPYALISVRGRRAAASILTVSITLHGTTQSREVPVRMDAFPGGISASGQLTLRQTDFGILPLSVLAGALQVQDRIDLRFHIVAHTIGKQTLPRNALSGDGRIGAR